MKQTLRNRLLAGLALVGALSTNASAAITAPTFDSADAITIGTAVITGLALIWAIKKAISLAK